MKTLALTLEMHNQAAKILRLLGQPLDSSGPPAARRLLAVLLGGLPPILPVVRTA